MAAHAHDEQSTERASFDCHCQLVALLSHWDL